jgi:hypothetical protein
LYNRLYNLSWTHHHEVAAIKKIKKDPKTKKLKISDEPDRDKIQQFLKKAQLNKKGGALWSRA